MVNLSKINPAITARNLGKPKGAIGLALADNMSRTNWPIYEAAFKHVGGKPGDRLLEVGFGNGKLVPKLLALADGLIYTGIDISETMIPEAEAFNRNLIDAGQASFCLASVEVIPFPDGAFDRAITINTIYFWPGPIGALAEIRRVLRPEGQLLVGAMTPANAARNPFTPYGFRIYDERRLRELFSEAGFRRVDVSLYCDTVPRVDGVGSIDRESYLVAGTA